MNHSDRYQLVSTSRDRYKYSRAYCMISLNNYISAHMCRKVWGVIEPLRQNINMQIFNSLDNRKKE